MAILGKACLTFFLLGWNIIRDKCIMAFLAEGMLTLDLLLVDGLLNLHHLVDAPHLIL